MAAERVVSFGVAPRGGTQGDPYLQLAGYVLARLSAWWPGKVGRELGGSGQGQQLFLRALAEGLARRRVGRELVDAGLGRIEAEGAEWPPLEVPRLLRYFSAVLDYEAAFVEAQRHAVARLYGKVVPPEVWSHPAVYWAADRLGWFEVRNASWAQIGRRWSVMLDEVLAWGEWPPIRDVLPDEGGLQTEGAHVSAMAQARALLMGAADRRDAVTTARIRDLQERGLWRRAGGEVS